MSDEVSSKDNEEAEQDEDNYSHYPSDHCVVHARRGRHGCGVLKRERVVMEERQERCGKDKKTKVMMRKREREKFM